MDKIIPVRACFDAYGDWSGAYLRGGKYGVTDLLQPARIVHLQHRHEKELPQENVAEKIKAFQGNAWHAFFEKNLRKANNSDAYKNRFLVEAKIINIILGERIAGKIDLYDLVLDKLSDWKVTGTYKAKVGDYEDWEEQLNIYAWFLRSYGLITKEVSIIMICPDWNKWEQLRDPKYPEAMITEIPLNIWLLDTTEDLIHTRVRLLKDTENLPDEELPECTQMDMWLKSSTFALMEPKKDRATRVLPSMQEMEEYIAYREQTKKPLKPGYTIVERKAERTRCENYCRVNGFCNQYQQYCMEKTAEEVE